MDQEYFPKISIREISFLEPELFGKPNQMLFRFVEYFDLCDCKEFLWDIMRGFICSPAIEELSSLERSNYLAFYGQLLALIEAIYLLREKRLSKLKGPNNSNSLNNQKT